MLSIILLWFILKSINAPLVIWIIWAVYGTLKIAYFITTITQRRKDKRL